MTDGNFAYPTQVANDAISELIRAMVEDGFFTPEHGEALTKYYSIYFKQSNGQRLLGSADYMVSRESPSLIADIPRAHMVKTFEHKLLESVIDRVAKLEAELAKLKG